MTIGPVSAPSRAYEPAPSQGVDRSAAPANRDARALADEFAAAAKRGGLPMPTKELPGGKTLLGTGKPVLQDGKQPVMVDGQQPRQPLTALARHGQARNYDALSEVRRDDSAAQLQLHTQGPGLTTPMQAPPPVAAHVDPGAFADMLTRLWTREQGRTAREVRVSFGDEAWPATGARLLRLDDGSLQVTVSMGQRGGDVGGGLDALRERLTARGLNISDIAVEDA